MNEYIIVLFPEEPPLTFLREDWPLHTTLLGTFSTEQPLDSILRVFLRIAEMTPHIETKGKSSELFGTDNTVPVTELTKTAELQNAHNAFLDALKNTVTLKLPQFSGLKYRPHVTVQKAGSIEPGETISLPIIALVEFVGDACLVHSTHQLT